jgi:glycosyl transferase family 25
MILENIWIINMDKSKDRLEKINKNLTELGIKFNRFRAIDGSKINKKELNNKVTFLCKNFLCNTGIIGCAESHKQLWKQLLSEKNTEHYLVLEDDVVLTNDSVKIINKLEPKLSLYDIDFLNLYCVMPGSGFNKTEFEIDDYKFGKPFFPLQTCGYIISKKGAAKLLQHIEKTTYHIDVEIAIFNLKNNLNYFTSNKNIIKIREDYTTIGNNNKCMTFSLLDNIGLCYYSWLLNVPVFTIKMTYAVNSVLILLFFLLILNHNKIKSDLLFWLIILELLLLHYVYL